MTEERFVELFQESEGIKGDFLQFDRVEVKRNNRADLHAFLLLDELMPNDRDMIAGAEHDKIWLAPRCDKLAEVITEEQVIELIRCGVMFDEDSLCMYA